MSNIQIPNLPAAIALNGTEQLESVQAGTSVRLTIAQIGSYIITQYPATGVTSIATNSPITGGTITSTGTIGLAGAGITNYYLANMAPNTVKANVTGNAAQPTDATPSEVLDIIGSTRGNVLYRGASNWAALPPGTSGYVLSTGGAGADPTWINPASTNITIGTTPVANGVNGRVLYDNAGILGEYAQVPVAIGGTGASTSGGASENLSTTYTVDNLAALKALTTRPPTVFMKGYSAANDGGEGLWEWVAGSSTTPNDGTVVACTSGTAGRYFRVVGDTIRPEWFGAVGDGVTIDSTAVLAAVNACNNQSILLNPSKTGYAFAVTVPITSGCSGFISIGGKARVVAPSTAGAATNIIYSLRPNFKVDNLFFDLPISTSPTVGPNASKALRWDGDGTSESNVWFTNNKVVGGGSAVSFGNGGQNLYITDNIVEDSWSEAIVMEVGQNGYIQRNVVLRAGQYRTSGGSGAIRTSAGVGVTTENLIISDNVIKDSMWAISQSSIDCFTPSAKNILITGNILDYNGNGIEFKTTNATPPATQTYRSHTISNNFIRLRSAGSGVTMNTSSGGSPDGKNYDVVISGNHITADTMASPGDALYGISTGLYYNLTISENKILNTARGIAFSPELSDSNLMPDLVVSNNTIKVAGLGIYSSGGAGTLQNAHFANNDVQSENPLQFRNTLFDTVYVVDNLLISNSSYAAEIEYITNGLFARNTFIVNAANYGVRAVGSVTSTTFQQNIIKTDATTGLDAFRIDAGCTVSIIDNQVTIPDTKRVYIGSGTVTAANNSRGTATATPTVAGSVGDVYLNSTPSSGGAESWVCTTAGASGAAVYTASLLGPSTASLAVGSTTISGGTTGRVLYDNAGVLGEMTTTGTGTQLVLSAAPTLTGLARLNGNLGVNASSVTTALLNLGGSVTGNTTVYGVNEAPTISSDVTGIYYGYTSTPSTAAAAFTLNTLRHYQANGATIGAGSAVDAQTGFYANSTLNTAAYNYGFYGGIAAAANSYNLYMNGTALNFMRGSLGIGVLSSSLYGLRVGPDLTGGTSAIGVYATPTFLSDVTGNGTVFRSSPATEAASFNLSGLSHYIATAPSFGAGSSVTTQYGFRVDSSVTGATNNYGFYTNLASATGVWAFYSASTAASSFGGAVTISGALTYGGVTLSNSVTGTGSMVLSTSPTLTTPNLGTPSAATLTNATGLPLSTGVTGTLGITNGGTGQTTASAAFNALSPITSTGDLIIGNGVNSATRLAIGANGYVLTSNGTTASWAAASGGMVYPGAGIAVSTGSAWTTSLTAPTGTIVGTTDTQTLTNKRVDPRISSTASASSVTPSIGTADIYIFTALATTLTINAATGGTPVNGDKLIFRIKDNGTSQTLTWTTSGSGSFRAIGVTLPTATTTSKVCYVGCIYNSDESYWDVVAVTTQA